MKKNVTAFLLMLSMTGFGQTSLVTTQNGVYRDGYKLPESLTKLQSSTMQLANDGNIKAMYKVAVIYQNNEMYAEAFNWFKKAAENGHTRAWFNLGMMYKNGEGTAMNYEAAFNSFSKAAEKNDPSGEYAKGYMLFKGLGCKQDYEQAVALFKKGVYKEKGLYPGKMYLYGICLRNGYGTAANADSAKYWLTKSAALGYSLAKDELMVGEAENPTGASAMAEKIKTALSKINTSDKPVNQYTPVIHSMQANTVEGEYEGYLIQYDWSGKFIIEVTKLTLNLAFDNGVLSGLWQEKEKSISIPVNARLTKNGLVFSNMQYAKKDHYSQVSSVLFNFEKANLQLLKYGDSSYLNGNLQLYSPDRKEPEKPVAIVLVQTKSSQNTNTIPFTNADGSIEKIPMLKTYPNPFTDVINIEFALKQSCTVSTQLLTTDGKIIFTTGESQLGKGSYILPLRPNVPPGIYIVRIIMGKEVKTTKLVKL